MLENLPCAGAATKERGASGTATLHRPATAPTAVPGRSATRLVASGACEPHPNKVERGGEDAFFVLGCRAIGVADGVGGWSQNGVDPGEYSRQLMTYTARALTGPQARGSAVEALQYAHEKVGVPGSSTAIVARCGCYDCTTARMYHLPSLPCTCAGLTP
jgi:protein phosphatase PTC7